MNKIPIPKNETERLNALNAYNILDTVNEEEFDRLVQLASLICDVPIALVSLIDKDRQWFKAKVGVDVTQSPRDISFCQFAIMGDEKFEVADASNDERFKNNPLVTDKPDIRFYAGYPLTDPSGFNLGTLCVIDRTPKKLDENQTLALKLIGQEVVSQIILRKKNIERAILEKLFNLSIDMICVAGTDGYFKRINPAFEKTLGWSEQELLEKPFLDYIHLDDIGETLAEIDKLAKGLKTLNFINRFRKKNGEYLILSWVSNSDSETGELFAIARDITESVGIMKELEKSKKTAEYALKVKDEFLANMSHEIRTPLNAIIGFNDLLQKTQLTSEQKNYTSTVATVSQNLMVIINDVLDVAKLESGILELEKKAINIKELAQQAIKLQSITARNKGIKLLLSIDHEIPDYVVGDGTRLTQILINLIGNAIKFTPSGSVELKVISNSISAQETKIKFSVKDTGIGIDKNKLNSIFDRFVQAETSTTRIYGGTGLGLSIVKMLVELFHGKLDLQSEVNKGSEFSFEIIFETANESAETYQLSYSHSNNLLKNIRILLVEDNEHNQVLASTYLKKNQASVDIAENGEVAIEKVKHQNYDVILMDLQMPKMDGYTATQIMRRELQVTIPIIACSAHSLVGEKNKCLEVGMNEYISKPYSEKSLVETINRFTHNSSNISSTKNQKGNVSEQIEDDFKSILFHLEKKEGKQFVNSMVSIFEKRIPLDIANLENAIEKNDLNLLIKTSHFLIGSLCSMSFENGAILAKEIESYSNRNESNNATRSAHQLIIYLKQALNSINQ